MLNKIKIPNKEKELLDVWIEGNEKSDISIIFVHGFAVNKHESAGYFDDLSKSLGETYRIIRFDFSGCGDSEGKLEEKDYIKWSEDLRVIIDYIKSNYNGKVYLLAQSMGCFITAITNPKGIEKTVFTGIPNNNTQSIINRVTERFGNRPGASINYQGISIIPRSSGQDQKIGNSFWQVLKEYKPNYSVKEFSKNTKLLIIHPLQDEIVGTEYFEEYSFIPGVIVKKLNGNHNFNIPEDREKLIIEIKDFFKSS